MQQNSVKETNLPDDNDILSNIESSLHKQQHNDVNVLYGDGEHAKESLQMFDAKDGEQNEANNMSLQIHEAQSNSNVARQVEHPDQKGDFSDDLVNAIKRVESRILSFQLSSNLSDSTNAGHHTTHEAANSDSPVIQTNNGALGSQMSGGKSLLEGHSLMNQKTCKASCEGENSISANAFVETFCAVNQNHWLHNSAKYANSMDEPK